MSAVHSIVPFQPSQPIQKFPLFLHKGSGQWAKKIRGRTVYFGTDRAAAQAKYEAEKEDLHAGRVPRRARTEREGTLGELVSAYLELRQEHVESGELTPAMLRDYREAFQEATLEFGKHLLLTDILPADFARLRKNMAAKWGPHHLNKAIQCVRTLLLYAYEEGHLDRPMRYGSGFDKVSQRTIRRHKALQREKLFSREELHLLLSKAEQPMKAMILLGINCGLGNTDIARLPALDLSNPWLNFPRPKTGINRRCPLWPETVQSLAQTQTPFQNLKGEPWTGNAVAQSFARLLDSLHLDRSGRGFYTLRHTFRTVADEAKDSRAADAIMGHVDSHISSRYLERLGDNRLLAVTEHVRKWLFGLGWNGQPIDGSGTGSDNGSNGADGPQT